MTVHKSVFNEPDIRSPELEFLDVSRPVEIRSASKREVGGYAAVFNSPSKDFGGWREIVESSFFAKHLGDTGFRDVVCKYEHRDLLGTVRARTLEVHPDSTGLPFKVQVPRSREDVYELVARGDCSGASFAFIAHKDEHRLENGIVVRHLVSGRLQDVSIVANPAYDQAHVSLRSFADRFGADESEVRRDFQNGELRRYFPDSGESVVIDLAPTPLDVAHRSQSGELDLRRRKLELQRIKPFVDAGLPINRNAGDLDLRRRRLALRKRCMDAETRGEPVESRSAVATDFRRDRYGHSLDWHPWQR
jgi:Escherichia/Staphylococcus phage prohead protease